MSGALTRLPNIDATYARLVTSVPAHALDSRFLALGGYTCIDKFWQSDVHAALLAETETQYAPARDIEVSDTAYRGGEPARKLLSADGGTTLDWVYQASTLTAPLRLIQAWQWF